MMPPAGQMFQFSSLNDPTVTEGLAQILAQMLMLAG